MADTFSWITRNGEQLMKCPCGAVMRKTFKGNWKCSRCKEVRSPEGKQLFVPCMRI